MKTLQKLLLATALAPIAATQSFAQISYANAEAAANASGMGGFIRNWGGTFLLIMIALGVVGLGWVGIELMFFDKEIRDVKKGLIGAVILIIAPAVIYAGIRSFAAV